MSVPDRFKGREEKARLKELEKVVEDRLKSVEEAADALREINEARLYKTQGFKTFADYCKDRWGFSKSSGYRLIAGKKKDEASEKVSQIGTPTQENENLPLCGDCNRLGVVRECPKCRPIQEAWRDDQRIMSTFNVPDWLVPAFRAGEKYESAARKVRGAASLLEFDKEASAKLNSLERLFKKNIAKEACGCSQDSSCDDCKSNGWLNEADAQRKKERVNF